jgi:hypothetical protein
MEKYSFTLVQCRVICYKKEDDTHFFNKTCVSVNSNPLGKTCTIPKESHNGNLKNMAYYLRIF